MELSSRPMFMGSVSSGSLRCNSVWCLGLLPPEGSLDDRIKKVSLSYAKIGCLVGFDGQCTSTCSKRLHNALMEVNST